MSDRSPIRIAIVGFVISLFFSLGVLPFLSASYNINPDPDRFGQLAANIAIGGGFAYSPGGEPVLERAPLYPLVLSVLFFLFGQSLAAAQVFHAFVHAATVYVISKLSLRVHSKRVSLLIGLLCAAHPMLLWYAGRIWIESLFTLLLVLIAYALFFMLERQDSKWSTISGVLIGLAALTKSVMLALPVLLFPFVIREGTRGLRNWSILFLVMMLTVLPWTLRNFAVSGSFVPVHTSLGFNLVQGKVIGQEWPKAEFFILDYWRIAKAETDSILDGSGLSWEDPEADRILISHRVSSISSPFTVIRDFVKNGMTFWYLGESAAKSTVVGVLQGALLTMVVVAQYGSAKGRRAKVLPIVLIAVFLFASTASIVGWGRYSAPLIPLLLILAFPVRSSGESR